ncbi:MAG: prepilin-type N-terminal cleavage/methylation domain-containing protein [Bacteroidales bacterium]|nr:prepilin-type N-terminal cleavage/methylation domain-containing protein [Bacteroidales bacterium]
MSNDKKISGFTLIELMVVISIVAILLLFSFPVFRDIGLFSDSASQVGNIVRLINDLKKRAVEANVDFILHMDLGSGMVWVTDDAMEDKAKEAAKEKGVRLSDGLTILDVEFPGIKETGPREYRIRFRKQGYSDFALIHIIEGENNITLKIEPFLSQVQFLDKHVYLEDCI